MTTSSPTHSDITGSTSGTPSINDTTTNWYFAFDPNSTAISNFTTPINSSLNSTTSSWLSTSSAYCSYVCVSNTTSALPNTTTVRVESIVPIVYADYYIGVILAIAQTFFGGFSYLFKKIGQNRSAAAERKRVTKRLAAANLKNLRASNTSLRNDTDAEGKAGNNSEGAAGRAIEAGGRADATEEAGAATGPSNSNFRYLLDYVWWLGMIFSAPSLMPCFLFKHL